MVSNELKIDIAYVIIYTDSIGCIFHQNSVLQVEVENVTTFVSSCHPYITKLFIKKP